jgi:molybdopterin synthase catalytic subunit
MFSIQEKPIDKIIFENQLYNPTVGAIVTFDGRVRNHHQKKDVLALSYQIYNSMALKQGNKIINEAKEKFDIHDAIAVHRFGDLNIEDIAVWVGISSHHRKAAFLACEYVIDTIKHQLPIWKKETYLNGISEWVTCTH